MQRDQRAEVRAALYEIPPDPFEYFVAELWERQGWTTHVTTQTADSGVDVVATRTEGVVSHHHVIQAKRYAETNVVGRPELQQYYSLKDQEDADAVIIVTTSRFSKQAERWADEYNLKLVDGSDVATLVKDVDAMSLLESYTEAELPSVNESEASREKVASAANQSDGRSEQYTGLRGTFWLGVDLLKGIFLDGYRDATDDDRRKR